MDSEIIKRTTLKAIFLDERLENILTLKGGNALHLHGLTKRESQDLDFSIRENIRLAKKMKELFLKVILKRHLKKKAIT
ncbi:nucleotidyl transferase AbiEii/AbiGii toxin family protein [Staphylococcus coagulans]|uniref:nucleotidyl transferase AbiEii/AbiGii toxin family protein n=1 Tax=Staphylococcus coagulans TaxID=74706 RepID=UPI00397F70DC